MIAAPELDAILSALADPTRRRVIDLLRDRPRRAGELVEEFSISAPAMSRHLRLLKAGGLIEEARIESDARVRLFRLRRAAFGTLHEWLAHIEGLWTEQLAAFKEHVEQVSTRGNKR